MITLLLFIFCWERRPTSSEIIIHIILITLVVTINWNNFSLNFNSGVNIGRRTKVYKEVNKKLIINISLNTY